MRSLGGLVASGISPEVVDAMDLGDLSSWYEIMVCYHKGDER